MRTKLFTLLGMILALTSQAQFIQQLTVVPANPTTTDHIQVIVDAGFPSGSCDEHTQMGGFVNASRYDASTLHCLGMLSFICYDADTFDLGVLTAGNYTFFVTVDAGGYPAPCTPGIVPGPMDSISFIVSTATGLPQLGPERFEVYPNPVSDKLSIKSYQYFESGLFIVYDATGRTLFTSAIEKDGTVDVGALSAGTYFIQYVNGSSRSAFVRFLKNP